MAQLRDDTGKRYPLTSPHLIGRARSANTTVRHPSVSSQHAALIWTAGGWTIRDLGSRNGTWLDGKRIQTGSSVPIQAGAVISLGTDEVRVFFDDDAPPAPTARSGDTLIQGDPELLALPSSDEPEVVILFDVEDGEWVTSTDEGSKPVTNGDVITVQGAPWSLTLPSVFIETQEAAAIPVSIENAALTFKVSADEEYVELTVMSQGETHVLPTRTHHLLLLLLARERLKDQEAGLSAPESGWLYADDLLRMLRINQNQLYISIHRARKEMIALGITDGAGLIERRTTSRQIRMGVSALAVTRLG